MNTIFESIEKEYTEIKENYISIENELNGYREKNTIVGYIYILINPSLADFEHMIKIGYSDDVQKRINSLSNTALPDKYHCYAWYAVTDRNLDKTLHSVISLLNPDLRYTDNREFFVMTKEEAYNLLEGIAKISGTMDRLVLNPLNDEYFNNHKTVENKEVIEKTVKESNISCSIVDDFKNRNSKVEEEIESMNKKNSYEYICVPEGFYHNKNKTAYAFVDEIGTWTILKGSYANTKTYERSAVHSKLHDTRWEHIENNIFKEDVNLGIVRPSGSANYIENHAMDGWGYWYTEEDIIIHEAFPRSKKDRNTNN